MKNRALIFFICSIVFIKMAESQSPLEQEEDSINEFNDTIHNVSVYKDETDLNRNILTEPPIINYPIQIKFDSTNQSYKIKMSQDPKNIIIELDRFSVFQKSNHINHENYMIQIDGKYYDKKVDPSFIGHNISVSNEVDNAFIIKPENTNKVAVYFSGSLNEIELSVIGLKYSNSRVYMNIRTISELSVNLDIQKSPNAKNFCEIERINLYVDNSISMQHHKYNVNSIIDNTFNFINKSENKLAVTVYDIKENEIIQSYYKDNYSQMTDTDIYYLEPSLSLTNVNSKFDLSYLPSADNHSLEIVLSDGFEVDYNNSNFESTLNRLSEKIIVNCNNVDEIQKNNYSFISVKSYYELLGKVVAASCNNQVNSDSLIVNVFPIPVTEYLINIQIYNTESEIHHTDAEFRLYNLQGASIFSKRILLEKDCNFCTYNINLPPVPAGLYISEVSFSSGISFPNRIIIQ